MTIADQPHAIVFVSGGSQNGAALQPCRSGSHTPGVIDPRYAIYPDRATADAARHLWSSDPDYAGYFSVPADALFHIDTVVKTTRTFTPKFG